MTALILDTETTDVENCEVIELGFIHYPEDVEPAFLRRYRPEGAIKWGALATHHILREELNDCPPAADAPGDVPLVDYWIGHNIDFDWRALGKPPVKRIDTLALCRLYWPEVDSHSLTAMAYFLLGANAGTKGRVRAAHAALDDVLICRSILEVIRKVHKIETMEELYAASEDARIPRKWTFGKFKGQPIEAADRGYANWCRKQPDFDPFVLEALRRANL